MGRFDIEISPLPRVWLRAQVGKEEFSCRACKRPLGDLAQTDDGEPGIRLGLERRPLGSVEDPESGTVEVWGLTNYNLHRGVGKPKLRSSPRRGAMVTWSTVVPLPVVVQCGCRAWCLCP